MRFLDARVYQFRHAVFEKQSRKRLGLNQCHWRYRHHVLPLNYVCKIIFQISMFYSKKEKMNLDVDKDVGVASSVETFIAAQQQASTEMRGNLSALKLIPHFLSKEECAFFRRLVAPHSQQRIQQLSNRKRLIFESEIVAAWVWNRFAMHNPFKNVIDEHGDEWRAVGINPRFRLVRYDQGDMFKTHEDGFYWESWNRKTFATAMTYLNDMSQQDGGSTRFHSIHTVVEPAEGLLVVFLVDNLDHCGEQCNKEKYLLRTDVFYELSKSNSDKETQEEFETRRKQLFAEFKRYDD